MSILTVQHVHANVRRHGVPGGATVDAGVTDGGAGDMEPRAEARAHGRSVDPARKARQDLREKIHNIQHKE